MSKEPSAWLITGSRIYKDAVTISESMADNRVKERNDGTSYKVPLYQAPPTYEQGAREMRERAARHFEAHWEGLSGLGQSIAAAIRTLPTQPPKEVEVCEWEGCVASDIYAPSCNPKTREWEPELPQNCPTCGKPITVKATQPKEEGE